MVKKDEIWKFVLPGLSVIGTAGGLFAKQRIKHN